MFKQKIKLFLLLLASTSLTACELINPAEPVPAYVAIDSVSFTTDYSTQGTASHGIIDGWLYVDNILIGGYEMPYVVPVTKTGLRTVSIQPGIKVNGISSLRSTNDLYELYDTLVNLEAGKTIKLYPKSVYATGTTVIAVDDFDDGGNKFSRDPDSDTTLMNTSDAFEGPFSGYFVLDDKHQRFSVITINQYVLPKNATNLLEINYKCNNTFVVGVKRTYFGQSVRDELLTVLSSNNKWKKIYVNLYDEVNSLKADYYNIYFYSQRDAGNSTAQVYLDNIKLVHN